MKHWDYSLAATHTCGLMVCCACGKNITEGQFRWRETERAYVTQHRACCENDPKWARLDKADAERAAKDRIVDELETLASELGAGLEPSNVTLHEAVCRSLQQS